jgi:hypothetical protein
MNQNLQVPELRPILPKLDSPCFILNSFQGHRIFFYRIFFCDFIILRGAEKQGLFAALS